MGNAASPTNDPFELLAAVVLGLAAVLTAWATFQSNEWGGDSLVAYAEGGKATTKAGTDFQTTFASLVRDASIDVLAKRTLSEADPIKDQTIRDAKVLTARYLFTQQLSDAGYAWLGLPAQYRDSEGEVWEEIPENDLWDAFERDLGQAYFEQQLEKDVKSFEAAEELFIEGGEKDSISDKFDLVVVLLTVAMFFAGIAQSFKTRVRWPILAAGALSCVAAFALLLLLPTAGQ